MSYAHIWTYETPLATVGAIINISTIDYDAAQDMASCNIHCTSLKLSDVERGRKYICDQVVHTTIK